MAEGATREQNHQVAWKMSRRPTAWFAWLLWGLIVALGGAAVIPYQIDWIGLTHLFSLTGPHILGAIGGLIVVFAIPAFATVGAVVATLRPKNGVGWLCLALSLLIVLAGLPPGVGAYVVPWHVLEPATSLAWNLTVPPLPVTLMLLIFPDGRLPSRRWWVVVAISLVGYVMTFLGVYLPADDDHIRVPIGVWISLAALLASVASVVLRWRRSADQERLQLKWLVYVVALPVIAGLGGLTGGFVWAYSYVPALLLVAAGVGLGIPVAIGVAVLKYRLYDIDVIINRTLVYGSLTALLALVYFGGVATTQALFRTLAGQQEQPQLAIVISTLVIAALFNPLRHRIQGFIDRRFGTERSTMRQRRWRRSPPSSGMRRIWTR